MARSTRALGYLSAGEVWRWGRFCIRGCWWRSCLPPRRFTVRQRYPKHVHSSENGSPPSKLIRCPSKAHSHLFTTLARFLLRGFLCGAKDCGAKPRKMPRIFLPGGVHVTLYRTPIFLPAGVRVTLYPQDRVYRELGILESCQFRDACYKFSKFLVLWLDKFYNARARQRQVDSSGNMRDVVRKETVDSTRSVQGWFSTPGAVL